MSLSQKTREVDSIIVETLFNRGVPLSTSQTYMPIVSYVGAYVPPPTYTVEEQRLVITSTLVNRIIITTRSLVNVSTFAGSGSPGSNNGIGTNASFNSPFGIAVDNFNAYVADTENRRIRMINIATGQVTTLAGSGLEGSSDGFGTNASFYRPGGIDTNNSNAMFVIQYVGE
jgi:hypothetical protein